MYCSHCGSAISGDDVFCRTCGAAQQRRATRPAQQAANAPVVIVAEPPATGRAHRAVPLAVAGFLIGGLIGFMMRPSVIFIGQLPFGTVITRGSNLTGIDQLLRSTAENSFNQMLTAAVLGAVAGVIVGLLFRAPTAPRA